MSHYQSLIAAFDAVMASAPPEPGIGEAIERARSALTTPARAVSGAPLLAPLQAALTAHAASDTAAGRLTRELAAIADELGWLVPYADHPDPDMQWVHTSYRYTPLVGPDPAARFADDRVAVFVTVQAPGVVYPPHAHVAPELYVVLGGSGDWQTGDGPFETKGPGDWSWHPSELAHAMTTRDEAMTALAIWTADTDSLPVVVRR